MPQSECKLFQGLSSRPLGPSWTDTHWPNTRAQGTEGEISSRGRTKPPASLPSSEAPSPALCPQAFSPAAPSPSVPGPSSHQPPGPSQQRPPSPQDLPLSRSRAPPLTRPHPSIHPTPPLSPPTRPRPCPHKARGLTCPQQDDLVVQGQLGKVRDPLGPLHQREELLVSRLADVGDGVVGLRRGTVVSTGPGPYTPKRAEGADQRPHDPDGLSPRTPAQGLSGHGRVKGSEGRLPWKVWVGPGVTEPLLEVGGRSEGREDVRGLRPKSRREELPPRRGTSAGARPQAPPELERPALP